MSGMDEVDTFVQCPMCEVSTGYWTMKVEVDGNKYNIWLVSEDFINGKFAKYGMKYTKHVILSKDLCSFIEKQSLGGLFDLEFIFSRITGVKCNDGLTYTFSSHIFTSYDTIFDRVINALRAEIRQSGHECDGD